MMNRKLYYFKKVKYKFISLKNGNLKKGGDLYE